MMDRRKLGDVLFYALNLAIEYRETLIDAFNDANDPYVIEAKKDIKAFCRVRDKLFPGMLSIEENMMRNTSSLTFSQVKKCLTHNEEITSR